MDEDKLDENRVVKVKSIDDARREATKPTARERRAMIEDKLYDKCPENDEVPMKDGFVSYCRHFKYLGPWMSYNLRDDYDIRMRTEAASKSFAVLRGFYSRPKVSICSKYLIFMAIQVNLLLWGCKSWALRKDLLLKLERFVNQKV